MSITAREKELQKITDVFIHTSSIKSISVSNFHSSLKEGRGGEEERRRGGEEERRRGGEEERRRGGEEERRRGGEERRRRGEEEEKRY